MDLLRGLLMVFESIDHARGFLSRVDIQHEEWFRMPKYHGAWTPFLMRLPTALCAPGFLLLMAWAQVLFVSRRRQALGWGDRRILRHFAIRGAVLVAANFVQTGAYWPMIMLTVLSALGLNLVLGALVLLAEMRLSSWVAQQSWGGPRCARVTTLVFYTVGAAVGLAAPSFYTPLASEAHAPFSIAWRVFFLPHTDQGRLFSIYPNMAWAGYVFYGLGIGRWMVGQQWDRRRMGRVCWQLAGAWLLLFLALRLPMMAVHPQRPLDPAVGSAVGFGHGHDVDTDPYSRASSGWLWAPRFGNGNPELVESDGPWLIRLLNLQKYPPSLTFTAAMLAGNHALLGALSTALDPSGWLATSAHSPLRVFGTSAFFFYILHFYLYGLLQAFWVAVGPWPMPSGFLPQPGAGLPDPLFWLTWLFGLILLYYACAAYGTFKQRQPLDSIWRFF